MRDPKQYEDDDGRTIADMSELSGRPNLLLGGLADGLRRKKPEPTAPGRPSRPWENNAFTPKERRMAILGALKASLLVGMAYVLGLGAIILLMILFWG